MRNFYVLLAVLLITGTHVSPASAKAIKLKVSVAELRAACSKAGGKFGAHADGGGYGCEKANCNGQGATCSVHCNNNNQCVGETPGPARTQSGMTLEQVLGYGFSATVGSKPPAGNILDSSGGFSQQGPAGTGVPRPKSGGVIIN